MLRQAVQAPRHPVKTSKINGLMKKAALERAAFCRQFLPSAADFAGRITPGRHPRRAVNFSATPFMQ